MTPKRISERMSDRTSEGIWPKPRSLAILLAMGVGLTACATRHEAEGPLRKEHVFAVTTDGVLIRFNAGQPSRVLDSKPVTGLVPGEQLVGLDFRVARGVLYTLSGSGRIYTLDTATGVLKQVGTQSLATALQGDSVGMDFNPAVDRIRIVTSSGQNLRAHPDTGVQVDSNPSLQGVQSDSSPQFDQGDVNAGQKAVLAAAAYTYNNENEKITTMYAIDRASGSLVRQGSKEGVQPFVSPDTGKLTTVGSLGTGPLVDAAFDISDVGNTPLIAVRTAADARTRLHLVDLSTGKATSLGVVGDGRPVIGIAIEP